MGLVDWLRRIFLGRRPSPPAPVARWRLPGVCPYCGMPLRTADARQCFVCGVDWHDPQQVRWVPVPPDVAAVERQRRLMQGTTLPGRAVPSLVPARPWTERASTDLAGLDASKFAPITRAEIIAIGGPAGAALRSGAWFGRRDLIPPAQDTRTHLIDRAMVTHGLLTPEELAHIHEIGAEMDRVRPDLALAGFIADQAVAQSEAERAALKLRKKQEAAERKRRHAEDVARREVIVNTDLKDFFPSITFPRVMGMFRGMGYSPAAATILALLCTEAPRRKVECSGTTYYVATGPRALPQGACTSPALSNRAARKLDARLAGLAGKLGWAYTRYADDATFSAVGEAAPSVGYLLARIRHISRDEGFAVNETKTRVLRRNTAQLVTGIVVNERPAAPRKLVRRLRAILHRAKTEGLAAQNRSDRPHFEAWLSGMIGYVAMVNPDQGQPLQRQLVALRQRERGS